MSSHESSQDVQLQDVFTGFFTDVGARLDDLNELETAVAQKIEAVLDGEVIQVPRIPTAAATLMKELNDPDVSAERISELVSGDAGLTADVLRLSNSALFRRGSREIGSMGEALVLIGLNNVKAVVADVLMQPLIKVSPVYFKLFGAQLWDHSRECAEACLKLAPHFGADRFQGYLLGLVHDVGKMVIFQSIADAFRTTHPDVKPRPHVFATLIALHSTEISCYALHNWDFPPAFADAIQEHCTTESPENLPPLARTLLIGNLISEARSVLDRKRLAPESVEEVMQGFGVSLDLVSEIFPDE